MVKEQGLLEKNSNCKHVTDEISLVKFDNCYHFWLFFCGSTKLHQIYTDFFLKKPNLGKYSFVD